MILQWPGAKTKLWCHQCYNKTLIISNIITNEIESYIISVWKRHSTSCVVIVGFFLLYFLGISAFFLIYIADMYLDDTLENQYQDEYTLFIQYS